MIRVSDILDKIKVLDFQGDKSQEVEQLVQLSDMNGNEKLLCWCSDKNMDQLKKVNKGTVICSAVAYNKNSSCNFIIVENPRLTFKEVVSHFFEEKETDYGVHPSASVDPSAVVSANVKVGQNVVIGKNVKIGSGTVIGANTVILKGSKLGERVKIGCSCTIGGVGFGYEKNEAGNFDLIPHIGNVVIEDDVEIGNNTAVDRAVIGSTILRKNVKVDNLVHIAHGVEIGENSLIIANAMIAGSVKIGKNVWVSPSSSVMNKVEIGDNAVIGMGAVVLKSVAANDVVVGNPAKSISKK